MTYLKNNSFMKEEVTLNIIEKLPQGIRKIFDNVQEKEHAVGESVVKASDTNAVVSDVTKSVADNKTDDETPEFIEEVIILDDDNSTSDGVGIPDELLQRRSNSVDADVSQNIWDNLDGSVMACESDTNQSLKTKSQEQLDREVEVVEVPIQTVVASTRLFAIRAACTSEGPICVWKVR